jgi:hypothetical protein
MYIIQQNSIYFNTKDNKDMHNAKNKIADSVLEGYRVVNKFTDSQGLCVVTLKKTDVIKY